MFDLLARVVTRRGWMVVVAWVAFAALLEWFAPPWSTVSRDDDVRFFPPGYPSVIGKNLQEQGFPNDRAESNAVIVAERPEGRLTRSDLAFVERLARALRRVQSEQPELGLLKVIDYREPVIGERFRVARPEGGEVVLTAVQLQSTFVAKQSRLAVSRILEVLNDYEAVAPEGLRLGITGSAAVGRDSNVAANESIEATTWATIVLVVAILLVVYRSPVLALIPLLSIALSVYVSLNLIALLANPPVNFQVINVTQVFIVVILYGAGTDYCLFLIARYREELARGRTRREALAEAIRQVGGALAASAGTVIVGLGMLWFSTFAKIRYSGPAIALSLAIGLLAALTLAPVFLDVLRGAVFWPFRPPHHVTGRDPEAESLQETPMFGFWARVSSWVIRRPLAILATSVLAMLPFAWFGLHTKASYDLFADMGPDMPSVRGVEIFRKYYPQGEVGPTTVLVRLPSVDFSGAEGRALIGRLSQELAALDKVAEVRSLTRPLGRPGLHADPEPGQTAPSDAAPKPAQGGLLGGLGLGGQGTNLLDAAKEQVIRAKILEHYASTAPRDPADRNHITRLDVVFTVSPFSEAGQQTLDRVAAAVGAHTRPGGMLAGAEVGYAGTTVQINDLKHVTTNDLRRMYVLVTIGVYVILVVLLRRPGICLYLIVTVIFGYLATLGLTDLVFKSLHHGPTPWEGLDWKVGFFLFVILVAVGEDYNIFLMTRVIEEENKHGPIEGTRRAVAHTGGIISSCGVIMAGTFGAMLFGKLTTLKQLGFALGLGVLLDTFVVRPILVPAFVVLWHKVLPKAKLDHHAPKEPAEGPASVDEPPPRPPMPAPAGAARFKHLIGTGGLRRGPRDE
jgi:RND superfamily putative drug exporter